MNPRLSQEWLEYLVTVGGRRDEDGWRWKIDPSIRMGGFGPWRPEWSMHRLPDIVKAITLNNKLAESRDFAVAFNKRPRVVVSRTLTGDPGWNATVLPDLDALAALKAQAGPDLICLGGADLAHSLAEADMIDAYRLMLVPYTLGGGKRLFEGGPRRDFTLTETITTDVGSLILTYQRKR